MNQTETKEVRLSFDTINELLTITYFKSQDLTGKTTSEFVEIYEKALQEIITIRRNHVNEVLDKGLTNCLNNMGF